MLILACLNLHMSKQITRLMTPQQMAHELKVSPSTLSMWDDCPCIRIGKGEKRKSVRYIPEEVFAYLKAKQQAYQISAGKEME